MFTLGNKEAIVNSAAKFPLTVDTNRLTIKGFGTFEAAQIRSCTAQRYIAPRADAISFDAPTAAELGVTTANVPVTFSIKIKSTRLSSEWANQYIINSRPLVFEILVSTGDTSANVATKMQAAFAEWIAKFGMSANGLPFTYKADATITGYLTLLMKEYYLYFQKAIIFKVDRIATPITVVGANYRLIDTNVTVSTATITDIVSTTGLCVGDTVAFVAASNVPTSAGASIATTTITVIDSATGITVASGTGAATTDKLYLVQTQNDATFDGKYLEENVRMSLSTTSDSYGISPDEKPIISGKYTAITFEADDATYGGIAATATMGPAKHAFLGTTRGEMGGTRKFKFTFYVLEGSDAFANGGWVETLISFFISPVSVTEVLKLGTKAVETVSENFRVAATADPITATLI